MNIEMDGDVKRVAEYMQASVPAAKLVAVAQHLALLSPILWGRHQSEDLIALQLVSEPISRSYAEHKQEASSV